MSARCWCPVPRLVEGGDGLAEGQGRAPVRIARLRASSKRGHLQSREVASVPRPSLHHPPSPVPSVPHQQCSRMSLTPSQWSNVDYIEPRNPSNIPSAIRLRAICQSTQASFVSSSSSSSLHSPPTFPNPPAVTLVPASSTQGSYLSQQTAIGKDVVQPIRARTRSTASSVASTSVPIQQPPLLGASPTVPANTRPRTNRHGKGRAVVSQGRDAAVRKTKAKALKGKVSGVDADELATRTSNRQVRPDP